MHDGDLAVLGVEKSGMISRCTNIDVCGTRTAFPACVRVRRYTAYLVIRRPESSASIGGKKNGLRSLWPRASSLVRLQAAPSTRPAVWGHSDLSGAGDSTCRVQEMRQGETGEAGLARGESVLYETLRLLRGTALPCHDHQGRCSRNAPGLEDSQGVGDAVHAGATGPCGRARTQGYRHRRDLDPQGPYLPHRGERPDSKAPDLVRGRGPQRGEHGAVLRLAGREEDPGHSLGGDGHVEAVLQRDCGACISSGDPVRQVPYHAPSGRSARRGAQVRVSQTQRTGSKLYQGPEVHAAFASREPHTQRPPGAQEGADGKQALEYGVPAQGVLRSTLGLRERGLGAAILRELAGESEVAAPETLREIRRDDRSALGRDRRLLQTREQGIARIRGRTEQQDPCHPASCIRTARRRVSATEGSHLHAPTPLNDACFAHGLPTVARLPAREARRRAPVDNPAPYYSSSISVVQTCRAEYQKMPKITHSTQ